MLMLNEFEIANFVAVVDSVELVKDVVDKELVFKQAMQSLFFAAYYSKIKFGCQDQIMSISAYVQESFLDFKEIISDWMEQLKKPGSNNPERLVGKIYAQLKEGFSDD